MSDAGALRWRCWLQWMLKGMAMGVADAVPGVSGGTLAVMLHIYERLIHAIKACNPKSLWIWRQQGVVAFWRHIDGSFLLALLSGIVLALLLMANLILFLLSEHYSVVMAFFAGMVLAACWSLRREVTDWLQLRHLFLLLLGVSLTTFIGAAVPVQVDVSLSYLFLCGMIAICAMILPGLSGAFILLVLGVYEQVLGALRALQWDIILVFVAGCVLGLLSFAHVLSWALRKQRDLCYAFLTGMLLASVVVLWPWRLDGGQAVLPARFSAETGEPATLALVLLAALAGVALISLFQFKVRHGVNRSQ